MPLLSVDISHPGGLHLEAKNYPEVQNLCRVGEVYEKPKMAG